MIILSEYFQKEITIKRKEYKEANIYVSLTEKGKAAKTAELSHKTKQNKVLLSYTLLKLPNPNYCAKSNFIAVSNSKAAEFSNDLNSSLLEY